MIGEFLRVLLELDLDLYVPLRVTCKFQHSTDSYAPSHVSAWTPHLCSVIVPRIKCIIFLPQSAYPCIHTYKILPSFSFNLGLIKR